MSIFLFERLSFRERHGFAEKLYRIASEEDYAALQNSLEMDPELGELIQGSGGARKVRMGGSGRGKRGGARVIYYFRVKKEIWFLDIYAKNEKSDLTRQEIKSIASFVMELKKA